MRPGLPLSCRFTKRKDKPPWLWLWLWLPGLGTPRHPHLKGSRQLPSHDHVPTLPHAPHFPPRPHTSLAPTGLLFWAIEGVCIVLVAPWITRAFVAGSQATKPATSDAARAKQRKAARGAAVQAVARLVGSIHNSIQVHAGSCHVALVSAWVKGVCEGGPV